MARALGVYEYKLVTVALELIYNIEYIRRAKYVRHFRFCVVRQTVDNIFVLRD